MPKLLSNGNKLVSVGGKLALSSVDCMTDCCEPVEGCAPCDADFCQDVVSITIRDLSWFCGDISGCVHIVESENVDLNPIDCTGDPLPSAVFTATVELFSTAVTVVGGASCEPGESTGSLQIVLQCPSYCDEEARWQLSISFVPECGDNDLNFISGNGPLVSAGTCEDIFGHTFDMYIVDPGEPCTTIGDPEFLVDLTVEVN